ncbi:MAG: exopolysaccharide Pel transporter PelG [Clostridium sp.]
MAGIGFELKGLFKKKGIVAIFKAYGYTGIITTGPMLLGILLLVGIIFLADLFGLPRHERELLICMITYALLASLLCTGFFSMVTTRYISDMIFEGKEDAILPSFFGSSGITLVIGGILYGIFLCFAGIPLAYIILNWMLFCEAVVVWVAINYLTAIKDYQGIVLSFLTAVIVAFISAACVAWIFGPSVQAFLLGVCLGYGVMMTAEIILLYRYFSEGKTSCFYFLRWFDEYRPLAYVGFLLNVGLFSHLIIIWFGPIGVQIQGLFYGAPMYDVAALMAFLSSLLTTINFVVSVEVNFYPKYHTYYSLFNDKGSIKDIKQAEDEMLTVLNSELLYTARKQLYMTALMISIGVILLEMLPLGFNDLMEGYFRILCVGYGIYAIGNTIMLMLLYFTDYKGALAATVAFTVIVTVGTILSLYTQVVYYGFTFMLGSAVYFLIAWIRLNQFTKRLSYHILSTQPIMAETKYGVFSKIAERLEKKEKQIYER